MTEKMKYIGGVDFEDLRSQRRQVYTTVEIALTAARTDEEFVVTGNYLYGVYSSIRTANIDIKLNERFRRSINIVKGRGVRAPFYRLYITNTAQVGQTITLAIGIESGTFEILDQGVAIEISGGVTIGGAVGTPAYGQVGVGAITLIKAANSLRRSILVQNLDPANALYIGYDASTTTANAGHRLAPYEAVELNAVATIYGIRAAGTGNAAYLEEVNT